MDITCERSSFTGKIQLNTSHEFAIALTVYASPRYSTFTETHHLFVSILFPLRVVSGSRDATLRVWDIETGQCLHVLMGHVAAVRCVQYDGRRVVSGAYDFMVKVWDPETETCLHTLQGHTNRVYSLQVSSFRDTKTDSVDLCSS